jgi:hypothetical protein
MLIDCYALSPKIILPVYVLVILSLAVVGLLSQVLSFLEIIHTRLFMLSYIWSRIGLALLYTVAVVEICA